MPTKTKPKAPIMLRTSERRTFRRCEWRWWQEWRVGLKGPTTAGALWFGDGIHQSLAQWYKKGTKRGIHPSVYFDRWVGEERKRIFTQPNPDVDETEVVDAKALGVAMLEHYIEVYGRDEHFSFIATEQPFQITVPIKEDGYEDILYCGTFDGVYRDLDDDTIWLIEHKTAKAIGTAHLPLDDQAGSYWLVATQVLRDAKLIGPKESLEGINYNFLRKALPDERPRNAEGMYLNKDGSVSKVQPSPYFHREQVFRFPAEQRSQIKRIHDESMRMQMLRNGSLPLLKNPNSNCSWDCPLINMCELHESGDDWESYRDAIYVVEDPYKDHRKSAAE